MLERFDSFLMKSNLITNLFLSHINHQGAVLITQALFLWQFMMDFFRWKVGELLGLHTFFSLMSLNDDLLRKRWRSDWHVKEIQTHLTRKLFWQRFFGSSIEFIRQISNLFSKQLNLCSECIDYF